MMIAGENSGDLHGSNLIKCLKRARPDISIFGFGGERMQNAGMEMLDDVASRLPIMGFTQVVKNLGLIRTLFKLSDKLMRERQPDLLIVIDYPGFNLRAARQAKKYSIPVVYYIAPQIWAWHKSRIKMIQKYVNKVLVILPFEQQFYEKAGVDAEFVGHPLHDIEEVPLSAEAVRHKYLIPPHHKVVGIIPGSRTGEVVSHLEIMLRAAQIIKESVQDVTFVLPRAGTVTFELLRKYLDRYPEVPVTLYDEDFLSLRKVMDFAICKSGTSTLEMALSEVPMVVIYRTSPITALIARQILRLKYISLVNIVAGREVVRELLQNDATPEAISTEALKCLRVPEHTEAMREELRGLSAMLGGVGASERAAEAVLKLLSERNSANVA